MQLLWSLPNQILLLAESSSSCQSFWRERLHGCACQNRGHQKGSSSAGPKRIANGLKVDGKNLSDWMCKIKMVLRGTPESHIKGKVRRLQNRFSHFITSGGGVPKESEQWHTRSLSFLTEKCQKMLQRPKNSGSGFCHQCLLLRFLLHRSWWDCGFYWKLIKQNEEHWY